MGLIIAITLAIVFGGLQFLLLWKGVRSLAKGRLNVVYFIIQFFCPLVGLSLCVWLAKEFLFMSASIICGIMLVSAIVYKINTQKQNRKKV